MTLYLPTNKDKYKIKFIFDTDVDKFIIREQKESILSNIKRALAKLKVNKFSTSSGDGPLWEN